MRRSKAWVGSLLVGAALAAAPAARAEEATPTTPSSDGGVCMEDPGVSMDRARTIEQITQELEANEVPESDGNVVQLNTRGYRYDADRRPTIARDLQVLDVEVRRARAAAKREGRL